MHHSKHFAKDQLFFIESFHELPLLHGELSSYYVHFRNCNYLVRKTFTVKK